jgi:uncharacterized protein YjbI with pentapeptide repeats
MDQERQFRRRPTRRQVLWTVGIVIVGVLIWLGYGYPGTGFGQAKVNQGVQPAKTLWDWLQLLIVPAALALGGYWLNKGQREREREAEDARKERELEVENQRAQDEALQAYLDQMGQLLTDKERPLQRVRPGDSLSTVARARTLTVLPRLDGGRKGILLRFLYESGLLNKNTPVFQISRADLSGADLSAAALSDATMPPPPFRPDSPPHRGSTFVMLDLSGANLSGANLNEAKLVRIILAGANLSRAHLNDADLEHTWLDEADLSFASLNYSKLSVTSLRGANLYGAHLDLANLRGANLTDANLDSTSLIRADLSGALLTGANLTGTNLHKAKLNGANLSGVDLSTVILQGAEPIDDAAVQAQLEQAKSLEGATMPNGQKYEDWLKSKGGEEDGEGNGPQ